MKIDRYEPNVAPDAVVNSLHCSGAAIVQRYFHGAVLETLQRDLEPFVHTMPAGSRSSDLGEQQFHGARTVRFGGVSGRSAAFSEMLCDPLPIAVAESLLLPNCGEIQCAGTQVMAIGSGEPAQNLHCDQSAWEWFNAMPNAPEVAVSAMVALTDFTAENGATRIVPGSNQLPFGSPEAYDERRAVQATMPAGSVLFYTGKVVHGAGANRSHEARIGLHIFYALGWLRSEEAHQLALDEAVAYRCSEQARRLLGFAQYTPKGAGGRLWTVDYEDPGERYRDHDRERHPAP